MNEMITFVGSNYHNLDSKNRLFIPVRYRDLLGEKFFVMPGADGCLFVYPKENFDVVAAQYMAKHRSPKEQTEFFSKVAEVTVDNQGRVTLDAKHIEYASLVKEVAVIGSGRRVEIWAMDKFKISYLDKDTEIDYSEDIDW